MFQCKTRPSFTLSFYASQLTQYCDLAPCTLVRGLYCINTFRKLNPGIPITPFSVYRILLTAYVCHTSIHPSIAYLVFVLWLWWQDVGFFKVRRRQALWKSTIRARRRRYRQPLLPARG
jgi:hypothetical protein